MTLFTEWSDVSQTSGAIGRFLAQTRATEEDKKTHYWHESTREFINARFSAAEAGQLLSVWTSSDVLYASAIGLSVFPDDPNLMSIVQGTARALSELVKERNSTSTHAKAIRARARTIAELMAEIGPGGLHDNLRDAMMLLGVPRSVPKLVQIYGPSHSISTASSLRALCAAARVIPPIRGEVEEAVGLLTEQLRSISHSEVITYLRLKKIGKEHAVDWQAYERELPDAFIVPADEVPEAGRAWSIATGFAVDMNGVKAWQLYPWKGRKSPDVIATAYVLDSLSASYVFTKDKNKAEAARIASDVIASCCGYLIPQTISLMCRQSCAPDSDATRRKAKECIGAGILDGVTVERITYSDLTRLIYAISNIVDALGDEFSDRLADLRALLCALVTKLMEKIFVDLSRFQRSPYDRITTRILSGAEVEEWPGVDVSFIVPALLASLPVLPQGFFEKYSGQDSSTTVL